MLALFPASFPYFMAGRESAIAPQSWCQEQSLMRLADAEGGICGEEVRGLGGMREYLSTQPRIVAGHHTELWTDELNQSPRIAVCAVWY